jgi:hypothetical protein
MMLDLAQQLGPCRVEHEGRLRVRGGGDQPAIVATVWRAGPR